MLTFKLKKVHFVTSLLFITANNHCTLYTLYGVKVSARSVQVPMWAQEVHKSTNRSIDRYLSINHSICYFNDGIKSKYMNWILCKYLFNFHCMNTLLHHHKSSHGFKVSAKSAQVPKLINRLKSINKSIHP